MGRMNKFTLNAAMGISSSKIYPIKEKLLDFEKKLDKFLYYFTPPMLSDHNLFETKHHFKLFKYKSG